jgi:hypothetical protein
MLEALPLEARPGGADRDQLLGPGAGHLAAAGPAAFRVRPPLGKAAPPCGGGGATGGTDGHPRSRFRHPSACRAHRRAQRRACALSGPGARRPPGCHAGPAARKLRRPARSPGSSEVMACRPAGRSAV